MEVLTRSPGLICPPMTRRYSDNQIWSTIDESAVEVDDEEGEECIHGQENARELLSEVVIRSGFLQKRSEMHKRWKRRWFVLRASRLAYYKNEKVCAS